MNLSRLSLGLFGMFLALFFFIHNLEYPARAAQIPLIFATAVGLLSVSWVIQELWGTRKQLRFTTSHEGLVAESKPRISRNYAKAFSIYVVALAYVYSIGVVGYFIASALFMGLSLLIVGEVKPKYAVIGTSLLLGTVGLVFFYFLGLNMPTLPTF